jgi:glycosyltransferase involved in cell wall biosynthesis
MNRRIKQLDLELTRETTELDGLSHYHSAHALLRLTGRPLGVGVIPIHGDCLDSQWADRVFEQDILESLAAAHLHAYISGAAPGPGKDFLKLPAPPSIEEDDLPSITVAVCTRNRPESLRRCLDSLAGLDYRSLEILVVDNAPDSDVTERIVRDFYPQFRYVCEPLAGLDRARNRAILEAGGDVIAFSDDDCVVDANHPLAVGRVFAEAADVMAVTGLVIPYELETEAQILFESYGGFGRGFRRRWYRVGRGHRRHTARLYGGTGQFGTGANMAYRRCLFDRIGLFDPALDVGTVTQGGGDLEMFFRVLKEGHTLVYEPSAIVRHRHRKEYAELHEQITNNGIGFYSYLVRTAAAYPEERAALWRLGLWWMWWRHARRLIVSFIQPLPFPRDLIWAELWGSLAGLLRYRKAQRQAVNQEGGVETGPTRSRVVSSEVVETPPEPSKWAEAVAVRTLSLDEPLAQLRDVAGYEKTRLFVTREGVPVGCAEIENSGRPISRLELADQLVEQLGFLLLGADGASLDPDDPARLDRLRRRYTQGSRRGSDRQEHPALLLRASVVVATRDRPVDLRRCLECLSKQQTSADFEIIVVDNNPSSGQTPGVVADFPGVRLVNESRKGLAYARNAGIAESSGEIIVTTDDDTVIPPQWLDRILAPFCRNDVAVVTGNVLPFELETRAQQQFELYGGLGRGFDRREAGAEWFASFRLKAVPTWELGATANAAFRTSIFSDPRIGMLPEELGPGTPAPVGEDTYVFYRVLKSGYTLVYEPAAYLWHIHRRTGAELRRQLFGYSKGHVAYHLLTVFRDGDLRGLRRVFLSLPRIHAVRLVRRMLGRSSYPAHLVLLEALGNLLGPWGLSVSSLRVRLLGRGRRR